MNFIRVIGSRSRFPFVLWEVPTHNDGSRWIRSSISTHPVTIHKLGSPMTHKSLMWPNYTIHMHVYVCKFNIRSAILYFAIWALNDERTLRRWEHSACTFPLYQAWSKGPAPFPNSLLTHDVQWSWDSEHCSVRNVWTPRHQPVSQIHPQLVQRHSAFFGLGVKWTPCVLSPYLLNCKSCAPRRVKSVLSPKPLNQLNMWMLKIYNIRTHNSAKVLKNVE
jgi:hypothetical protein